MKLTAKDYYKANDPDYLADNPEIKDELLRQQRKCVPAVCEQCCFFKMEFNDDLSLKGALCAIDRHEVERGKMSQECALRRKNDDKKRDQG